MLVNYDGGSVEAVMLGKIIASVRARASREMIRTADTITGEWLIDHIADTLWCQLRAAVLAEQLPPQAIRCSARALTDYPRYATWRDHWKATHRGRWWARWLLRSHRWRIKTTMTPVAVQGEVTVNVHDHWTYPRAPRLESLAGAAVMVSTMDPINWREV